MSSDSERALRRAGLRPTRQRLTVLGSLRARAGVVTAQDLHLELRQAGERIGLTTVYRTLGALADAGLVDVFERDGEQAFRACTTDHHHHLVCQACDRVEEITAEEVERWVGEVARRRGYEVISHQADIIGVCGSCQGGT